jgi:hypothetical protein
LLGVDAAVYLVAGTFLDNDLLARGTRVEAGKAFAVLRLCIKSNQRMKRNPEALRSL